MNVYWVKASMILLLLSFIITGCSKADDDLGDEPKPQIEVEEEIESPDIQLTSYAEEVGFSLESPTEQLFETHTVIDVQGNLDQAQGEWEHIWVVVTREEAIEKMEENGFNYYLPVENGGFSDELILHHGEGEYEVSIRIPSNKTGEADMYYDVATFNVINLDEDIQREVEYTAYGVQHGISLTSPERGINDFVGSVFLEGTIPENAEGDRVLVQVKKGNESEQIILPLAEGSFSGDVPLYFGEGLHTIRVQSFNEHDAFYYDSAIIYAHNSSPIEFAEVTKTQEYIDSGITLYEPNWIQSKILNKQEYWIVGEVDPKEDIEYIIVSVNQFEDDLESGYVIPVENGSFDGLAYFRFGPGNYEVVISVPAIEQHDQSMFHYQGVVKINHEVVDIKDERGLLPSRGTESDHQAIIEQAEQITANLESDRDKAEAIYKFVAQHVAYDVNKAENDLFNIGDSALSTLQSGSGICQDYAFLTTALLRSIGMESHYIQGDAGERHAWVEVKVDEEWLEMDPTWGAGYVQEGVFQFDYNEDYFDPDPDLLAKTHTRDGVMY